MRLEYRLKIAGPDAEWKPINATSVGEAGRELVQLEELAGPISVRDADTKEHKRASCFGRCPIWS